jgi:hypothetical protein
MIYPEAKHSTAVSGIYVVLLISGRTNNLLDHDQAEDGVGEALGGKWSH